jgi:hypothetical protein
MNCVFFLILFKKFKNPASDILKLLIVICASEYDDLQDFCRVNLVRFKVYTFDENLNPNELLKMFFEGYRRN